MTHRRRVLGTDKIMEVLWNKSPSSLDVAGGSRANLKEEQLVFGALKHFRKLVTSVRCIQQFQTLTTDRRLSIHFVRKFSP